MKAEYTDKNMQWPYTLLCVFMEH